MSVFVIRNDSIYERYDRILYRRIRAYVVNYLIKKNKTAVFWGKNIKKIFYEYY